MHSSCQIKVERPYKYVEKATVRFRLGVGAQRTQDAPAGDNVGVESNVPQDGVVWVFAVKK